ncbi:MAG: hypothetical protein AAGF73_08335 [Actinomycetota bacterium]
MADVIALLIYAPVELVSDGAQYGAVFAAMVYVLQFIEDVLTAPLHLQQLIRLGEIGDRLRANSDQRPSAAVPEA